MNFLGATFATLLTLAIFSRAFGENRAFQWASHMLMGLGAGYVGAVVVLQVILPALNPQTLLTPGQLGAGLAALGLTALLGLRLSGRERVRAWGLPGMGLLGGVWGALALAGAMRGTLLPQLMAPLALPKQFFPGFQALDGLTILVATLTAMGVLLYLLPVSDRKEGEDSLARWVFDGWRLWGYWALMLALGALLASVAGARITLLIDRVQWLLGLWF
jgi:hypothetical protein